MKYMNHLVWVRVSAALACAALTAEAWKLPVAPHDLSAWLAPHRHAWYPLPLVLSNRSAPWTAAASRIVPRLLAIDVPRSHLGTPVASTAADLYPCDINGSHGIGLPALVADIAATDYTQTIGNMVAAGDGRRVRL